MKKISIEVMDISVLKQLVLDYSVDVDTVCHIMLEGLNITTKEELIAYREQQPMGEFYLDGENKYVFHGRGCRFTNDEFEIDWDFGDGELWCGLDPWKIAYYISSIAKESEWCDGAKIKNAFDNMVKDGLMYMKYGLYYFDK